MLTGPLILIAETFEQFTKSRAKLIRYSWIYRCATARSLEKKSTLKFKRLYLSHRISCLNEICRIYCVNAHCLAQNRNKKVALTRLPSVRFRSWSRFLTVSLQVTWVINQAVGCHYFPPGPQLLSQPLSGLLPVSVLGEQRHDGCEQFAEDASRLRFEAGSFCAWVQHANHSATEPAQIRNTVAKILKFFQAEAAFYWRIL